VVTLPESTVRVRLSRILSATTVWVVLVASVATTVRAQCPQSPVLAGDAAASPGGSPTASADLSTQTACVWRVSVTPDGSTTPSRTTNTSGYTASFTVTNTGSGGANDSYVFTCIGTGGVSCTSFSPTSKALSEGASTTVTATYGVGGTPGTGRLTLQADGQVSGVATDQGYYNVPIVAPAAPDPVSVTPDGASSPIRAANTGGYTAQFTVQNLGTGSGNTTYTLTCSAVAPVNCGTSNLGTVTLDRGTSTSVNVSYYVGAAGVTPGTLTLTASATGVSDNGWYSILVPGAAPAVALAGIPGNNQEVGRCAANCFQAAYAFGTVPYFSLGAPRSVALVYRQDRATPRPFVHVDVQNVGTTTPLKFWLQAKLNGAQVTFVNGEQTLKFTGSNTKVRLGGQFDGSGYTTGLYTLEVTVTSEFSAGNLLQTVVTDYGFIIVNEQSSSIARGWTLGGIQRLRLLSNGAVLTDGLGSARFFSNCGSCDTYNSPAGEFSRLQVVRDDPPEPGGQGPVIGYERVYPDSSRIGFDLLGRMVTAQDAFGNTSFIAYDASGRVWKITDPMNRTITLTYNGNGLSNIQDPGGRNTAITVDATPNRRLTTIADPDGKTTAFTYDAGYRLKTVTDRRGFTRKLGYGSGWELTRDTLPAVAIFGAGNVSLVNQFSAWQVKGVPYTATATTPFTPPAADTVYGRTTEPGGAVTRFTVNRWGQPLLTVQPLGDTTQVAYTADGLPAVVRRPGYGPGEADTVRYGAGGLPTYVRKAGLAAQNIRYAGYAQADSTWGQGQPGVHNFIGYRGRVDSVRIGGTPTSAAVQQRLFYNTRGQVDSVKDAGNIRLQKNTYDAATGNLAQQEAPGSRVTTYTYDAFGRVISVARPGLATVRTYYDVLDRPDSVSDGVNAQKTKYTYDALYRIAATDPKGQVYRFTQNALGWPTAITDPAGAADSFYYNVGGDLVRKTTRLRQHLDMVFDSLHRPTSATGSVPRTWTYANHGRKFVATSSGVVSDTGYQSVFGAPDSVKRVLGGRAYVLRYSYAAAGQLDSLEVSGAGIAFVGRKYLYDPANGGLKTIRLNGQPTNIGRDANLLPNLTTLAGGDAINYLYGSLHLPLKTWSTAAYNGTTERSLGLDAAGRVNLQLVYPETGGNRYGYDGLGRLVADTAGYYSEAPPPWCPDPNVGFGGICNPQAVWITSSVTSYTYDAVGNRTDRGGTYGSANRVTRFDGCAYTTNGNGEITARSHITGSSCTRGAATFTWNAEGTLASVTFGGQTVALVYDAAGRLTRRSVNGTTQSYFLWDGADLLAELDGAGTAKRAEYSYYPGLDRLHAVIVGTTSYFAHRDASGSVIALTDASARVKRWYGYDRWGTLSAGGDSLPFGSYDRARWKGALLLVPELNLYYMRSRWYEGGTGRFLSEDPLGLAGGINPYVFAGDDPMNNSDPSGKLLIFGAGFMLGCGRDPDCWSSELARQADAPLASPALAGTGSQSLSSDWLSYSAMGCPPNCSGFDGYGGGGGFSGAGSGGCFTDTEQCGPAHPIVEIQYDPRQWKTDPFHNWSRVYDYDIVLRGSLTIDPDGYQRFNLRGTLEWQGAVYTGTFELWGYPIRGALPGSISIWVNHRFFRPDP
jgi:RHS repeat-associated protein